MSNRAALEEDESRQAKNRETIDQTNSLCTLRSNDAALRATNEFIQSELNAACQRLQDATVPRNAAEARIDTSAGIAALERYGAAAAESSRSYQSSQAQAESDRNQMEIYRPAIAPDQSQRADQMLSQQSDILRKYADSLEGMQKLGLLQIKTSIYSGLKSDQLEPIERASTLALKELSKEFERQIDRIGDRMRDLTGAPKYSTGSNLEIDRAGTAVIRAEFGERGSVTAVYKDGVEAHISYTVNSYGDVSWTATASGPNESAKNDGSGTVNSQGPFLHLKIKEPLADKEDVTSTHSEKSTDQRGPSLTGIEAGGTAGAEAKGVKVELGANGKLSGDWQVLPDQKQTASTDSKTITKQEDRQASRNLVLQIQTYMNGSPVTLEQDERRHGR